MIIYGDSVLKIEIKHLAQICEVLLHKMHEVCLFFLQIFGVCDIILWNLFARWSFLGHSDKKEHYS